MNEKTTPISLACKLLGSQTALAKALGISSPTVHEWVNSDRPVPIQQAVRIEFITNGAVTRQMLRPDDWLAIWPELAEPVTPTAVQPQKESV